MGEIHKPELVRLCHIEIARDDVLVFAMNDLVLTFLTLAKAMKSKLLHNFPNFLFAGRNPTATKDVRDLVRSIAAVRLREYSGDTHFKILVVFVPPGIVAFVSTHVIDERRAIDAVELAEKVDGVSLTVLQIEAFHLVQFQLEIVGANELGFKYDLLLYARSILSDLKIVYLTK